MTDDMPHVALKIAYLGKYFHGSQRQPIVRTVEGDLIQIMREAGAIEGADINDLRSAGRTDRGVSALGNVLSFYTEMPLDKLLPALDANLEHIFPMGYAEVGPDFNPRKAETRWYRYHLRNEGHDIDKMKEATDLFPGYHDFTQFAKLEEGRDPNRRLHSVDVHAADDLILVDVKGQSFLWNMVRRMTQALSMVGLGECTAEDVGNALEGDEKVAFPPLPSEGLMLMDVSYKNVKFKPVKHNIVKKRLENVMREQELDSLITNELYSAL